METKLEELSKAELLELAKMGLSLANIVDISFSDNKPITRNTACGMGLINAARAFRAKAGE